MLASSRRPPYQLLAQDYRMLHRRPYRSCREPINHPSAKLLLAQAVPLPGKLSGASPYLHVCQSVVYQRSCPTSHRKLQDRRTAYRMADPPITPATRLPNQLTSRREGISPIRIPSSDASIGSMNEQFRSLITSYFPGDANRFGLRRRQHRRHLVSLAFYLPLPFAMRQNMLILAHH